MSALRWDKKFYFHVQRRYNNCIALQFFRDFGVFHSDISSGAENFTFIGEGKGKISAHVGKF